MYITDNAYTQSQIRQMEIEILRVLNFDLVRSLMNQVDKARRPISRNFVNVCKDELDLPVSWLLYIYCGVVYPYKIDISGRKSGETFYYLPTKQSTVTVP